MEKVVRKVTFEEAERLDIEYWANKTVQEKWSVLTDLRLGYIGTNNRIQKVVTYEKNGSVAHDR
jgi:hypothetical protein